MLELKHISYTVPSPEGGSDILRDVSLTVEDGKLLVLTGPNGGGKTTLARIIMVWPCRRRDRFSGTART